MRRQSGVLFCVVLGLGVAVVACGAGGKDTKAPRAAPSDAGAEAGATKLVTSPPPSNLPPMAQMPPPGVAGSKKGRRKADSAVASCAAGVATRGADPAGLVKRAGEACAAAAKAKPSGAILRGNQDDKGAHQELKFRAEAGKCYRVYFASDETAKDVVISLRDSAGDVVAEAPAPAVPQDGTFCFTSSDEVTLLVGVGSGKGAWAAQVWSD